MWDLALERDGEKIEEGVDKPEEGGGGLSQVCRAAVTQVFASPKNKGKTIPLSF